MNSDIVNNPLLNGIIDLRTYDEAYFYNYIDDYKEEYLFENVDILNLENKLINLEDEINKNIYLNY